MPSALVIGHSHLAALHLAYRIRTECKQREGVELHFIQLRNDRFRPAIVKEQLNPEIRKILNEISWGAIISMVAGNDHNVLGLVNHPIKFDFVLPEVPSLPLQSDADVLPYGLIRRCLAARIRTKLAVISALRTAVVAPVFHMESPPPIPSEGHIRAYPGIFKDKIDALGVAPATLRYKLWRVHSSLVREHCMTQGITFIPAPQAMQDEDGMLVEDAWNNDPTHGNRVYGEHLFRQILSIFTPHRNVEA